MQGILNSFIWNGKRTRVKHSILCTPTGGMEAPNITAYLKATILDQAKAWWDTKPQPTWLQIKKIVLATCPKLLLSTLLLGHHGQKSYLGTINATIKVWKEIYQHTKGLPYRILPLISLSALQIIIPDISESNCLSAGLQTIGDLYQNSSLTSFQHLQHKYHIPSKDFFKYLRFRLALLHLQWLENPLHQCILEFYNTKRPTQRVSPISTSF